jgi:Tfp pilus assembly protein PilN
MKAINLLPPDLRGTPKTAAPKAAITPEAPGGIGAFVVLGALAACVVAVAAYVLTTNTVKDRQAQLEAVTAQAAATTQRVNQLKPYADFQAMAETRIQTVKDLASSRFDWEQALRDISRAVPANVTLRELNGTISGETASGGSSIRGAIAAPAIELKGCTAGQKDVATLLSRLRNVDGVTRVSLNKSLKPDKSQAPAASSPIAGGTESDGCPGKRPPNFEIVMFFEGAEVPETVEDITVQPGAGAQPTSGGTTASTDPSQQPQDGGVTTPPADPAESGDGTATPASTPEGGAAQ